MDIDEFKPRAPAGAQRKADDERQSRNSPNLYDGHL
jgi:hypothetical protein